MRKITITFAITAVAMFTGLAACGDDTSETGSGGSGNTGNASTTTSANGGSGGTGSANGGAGGGTGATGGGSGGSAAELAHCGQPCAAAKDCCPAQAMGCPDMGLTQYTCDTGECVFTGCKADADCELIPNYKCFQEAAGEYEFGVCGMPCTGDTDCAALMQKCLGDKDGDKYCKAEPGNPPPKCTKDTDCAANPLGEKCDVDSGSCTCAADTDCKNPTLSKCFM